MRNINVKNIVPGMMIICPERDWSTWVILAIKNKGATVVEFDVIYYGLKVPNAQNNQHIPRIPSFSSFTRRRDEQFSRLYQQFIVIDPTIKC